MALRELGRIERTLFTLDWIQSVDLRRRVQAECRECRGHGSAGVRVPGSGLEFCEVPGS